MYSQCEATRVTLAASFITKSMGESGLLKLKQAHIPGQHSPLEITVHFSHFLFNLIYTW